ncbi:hypothetical protein FACS1894125_3720 [Actinomycetota bacterium]|nr:hypothetical protein FACS1894125_3720 [Actinomycetota bacterium]
MKHFEHIDYKGIDYDERVAFYERCSVVFNCDLVSPFEEREIAARKTLFANPTKSKSIRAHPELCKYKNLWEVGRTSLDEKPTARNFIYNFFDKSGGTNYILALKPDLPDTDRTMSEVQFRNNTKSTNSKELSQ